MIINNNGDHIHLQHCSEWWKSITVSPKYQFCKKIGVNCPMHNFIMYGTCTSLKTKKYLMSHKLVPHALTNGA